MPHRILIVGGGFAGFWAALAARRVAGSRAAVTLVSPEPLLQVRPRLYEARPETLAVDMLPLLRKVIDAFGVERVMWASDYTQSRNETGYSWAHTLHYLLDSDQLSETEKEWLLGRSVRQVLRWPAPAREEVSA
jgi:2-polyprenyl-6-methoxyphenol hydroxylase-like FAD-dependent oxidoreductase